jgi:hypothetical protein
MGLEAQEDVSQSQKWEILYEYFNSRSLKEIQSRGENTKKELIYMVWAMFGRQPAMDIFGEMPVLSITVSKEAKPENANAITNFFSQRIRTLTNHKDGLYSSEELFRIAYPENEYHRSEWRMRKIRDVVGEPFKKTRRGCFYSAQQFEKAKQHWGVTTCKP